MLYWIIAFFVLALLFSAVGFSGAAATFSSIAQLLAVVFAVLFIASIVMGGFRNAASGSMP
jgi:uncharacterized membrane protein YtjA (UPF0391 family)